MTFDPEQKRKDLPCSLYYKKSHCLDRVNRPSYGCANVITMKVETTYKVDLLQSADHFL